MSDFLTTEQIRAYKQIHKQTRSLREGDRIKAILLLNKGYSYKEVAELLLIDAGTVRRWHMIYETSGVKTLLNDNYNGGTSKLTTVEQLELTSHLEYQIYLTAKEICVYVETKYCVIYFERYDKPIASNGIQL
jgi:transposase